MNSDKLERIYRRTASGRRAWVKRDPAVSEEDRRVLALIDGDTHWETIEPALRRHADRVRLAYLEAQGFIEAN
jgi:hypothetical protein